MTTMAFIGTFLLGMFAMLLLLLIITSMQISAEHSHQEEIARIIADKINVSDEDEENDK